MSFKTELFLFDKKFNVLNFEVTLEQPDDGTGLPTGRVIGGKIDFTIEAQRNISELLNVAFSNNKTIEGRIRTYGRDGLQKFSDYEFANAYVTFFKEHINTRDNSPVTNTVTVSAGIFKKDGAIFENYWNPNNSFTKQTPTLIEAEEKPTEQKQKKEAFKIKLKAKSSDIKNGLFGFDSIPKENIVESDYEKLKNEYNPLSKKILGDEYIPSWLSLRKDQTVELELDWTKKGRADDYKIINFESHSDFTFEPENLKDSKTVKITCKNNSESPTQILIKADNELTVGALNIFYPKHKTIDLEWCFVEIQGNKTDYNKLDEEINKSKLENSLKKGLNPTLIDVSVTNKEATIIDINEHLENLKKHNFIKEHLKIGSYIERSKLNTVLNYINNHDEDPNKITVYFINQKCINEIDIQEDSSYKALGGISPKGTGIAYLVLDTDNNINSENIIHEIMHALGLGHTFEGAKHKFKQGKTYNYMDYYNNRKHTYKWQWEKLQEYSKLK